MFNARVISGDTFEYHPRNNPTETRTGFILWFTFEGSPYSFKMGFFNQDQIEKAKAAVASGKAVFKLEPDNNIAPRFVLA